LKIVLEGIDVNGQQYNNANDEGEEDGGQVKAGALP
jgi:hypothetical protein